VQQFDFPYELALKSQMAAEAQELISAAEAATEKAYAPYSKFRVGAALLLTDGSIITGANHENAVFPAGICAERAVLAAHNMEGPNKIKAIAIAYKIAREQHNPPLAPCGICRQSILEVQQHQSSPITVYMSSPDGEVIMVEDASFLLPFYFSGTYL
jgi:cytidine deaminase